MEQKQMKVIDATYEIYPLHEPSEEDVLKHIEKCGRICYQSRGKITTDSAKRFVKRVVDLGHWSVLEMANIVLKVPLFKAAWLSINSPYLTWIDNYVSGSPRAFLEVLNAEPWHEDIAGVLHKAYPTLFPKFKKSLHSKNIKVVSQLHAPSEHRKYAVEFTVDRAFSHELVRHRPCSYLQESQRYCAYRKDVTFIQPPFYKDYMGKGTDLWKEAVWWRAAMSTAERFYHSLLKTVSPQVARKVLPNSTATHIICYTSQKQWEHILDQRTSSKCDPSMYTLMRTLKKDLNAYWENKEN